MYLGNLFGFPLGGLFNLAVRLMQLFSSDDNTNYVELTSLLGLYFQGSIHK